MNRLLEAKRVVIFTHINPDADSLGSALGLYHFLTKKKKKVWVYSPSSSLPYNLDFLPGFNKIKTTLPKSYDLAISCDCGSFDRLGVEKVDTFLINFDHHASNDNFGDINIVDPLSSSTSEVVYWFLKRNNFEIPLESAICFYTAMVDDNGFFKYDRVKESTFLMAKELCEIGVNPNEIATLLTMREPLSKLRLTTLLLEGLELKLEGKVALLNLTLKMLEDTQATKEMAQEALDLARALAIVEVAILFREENAYEIKVSLRSKNRVEVGKIALEFGGGGHKLAAGFTFKKEDKEQVLALLLKRIQKELGA